jgi:UDP-MurNAc hydroxylase
VKLTLVSHASVIIETADARVWTDPWLFGTAFNESWTLCPAAVWDPVQLERIQFIWISHEHPDHFHLPTLRSLPESFKQRVTVLYQQGGSDQIALRLSELGFKTLVELQHRQRHSLGAESWAYSYREGPLNACLAVGDGTRVMLDVNDARLGRRDCALLRKDLGPPAVVLNQFSLAGYGGAAEREQRLPELARQHLESLSEVHRWLGAEVTVPFASFVRFAQGDNAYMNAHATHIGDAAQLLRDRGQGVAILAPGDSWVVGEPCDALAAIERIERGREACLAQPLLTSPPVPLQEIAPAFEALVADLRRHYPASLLRQLRPVRVAIPDLNTQIVFSVPDGTLAESSGGQPDLEINSEPLCFAFSHHFGMQTLGVSARLKLLRNARNWHRHRILLSLQQAGVHLRPWPSAGALLKAVPRFPANLRHLARRLRSME